MNQDVTAIILAGGRGSRMGGIDKGLLEYKDSPLVKHVTDCVSPQAQKLIISANRNLERYRSFGYPVINDELDNFQGPLSGILTAGKQASTPLLLTAPCDTPALPADLCGRLYADLQHHQSDIAIAHDGERTQQLCMLFRIEILDDIGRYLDSGERSVIGWVKSHKWTTTDFSDKSQYFLNINRLT